MKKILTVLGIAVASVPAALLVVVGFISVDLARVVRDRRNRGTFERVPVSRQAREDFNGRLEELEFRVINRGQTVIPEVR